ncbi:TPA: hypothetical protein ACP9FK_003439 [Legionella anisa]|uniref:hypothetical protein n=1 Tax=Legionella anisa TaxID=28082 RepID=UPI00197CE926|nr:hypothetical protein [Legionella anisa]MBN5937258.1 hypothetical protein [Legionella anisa]
MKKLLRFEVKQNLRRPSRIYVRSADDKSLYGSFRIDEPDLFDGWDNLSINQVIELKQFIQNLKAVNHHLNPSPTSALLDLRFRLPYEFIEVLEQIEIICDEQKVELNIFEPMVSSMIQQIKIAVGKLSGTSKEQALMLLNQVNLAEYKKQDFSNQIKSIFSELQAVVNRSEKLHHKAKTLFDKDKSYSPMAIKSMSSGETTPSKWLVACAIEVLLDEKNDILFKILTEDDVFMLWAKQLIDQGHNPKNIMHKIDVLNKNELMNKIKGYKK